MYNANGLTMQQLQESYEFTGTRFARRVQALTPALMQALKDGSSITITKLYDHPGA